MHYLLNNIWDRVFSANLFLFWWLHFLSIILLISEIWNISYHDDVIKWKHFPRNWPFVWGIHRSPVNSPHKGQWRGALMFPLICVWIHGWENNREAGDLRRIRPHYDVTVMLFPVRSWNTSIHCVPRHVLIKEMIRSSHWLPHYRSLYIHRNDFILYIFGPGCTGSFHNNFRCSQWRKFRQNDDIFPF